MEIYNWNNDYFCDYDLFVVMNKAELAKLEQLFHGITAVSQTFDGEKFYYWLDSRKKIITPLPELSFAFGGGYNGYPPYGNTTLDVYFDFTQYRFRYWEKRNPLMELKEIIFKVDNWGILRSGDIARIQTVIRRDKKEIIIKKMIADFINKERSWVYELKLKCSAAKMEDFFQFIIKMEKEHPWQESYEVDVCDGEHWDFILKGYKNISGTIELPPHAEEIRKMLKSMLEEAGCEERIHIF